MKTAQRILPLIIALLFLFPNCTLDKKSKQSIENQNNLLKKDWSKWIKKNSYSIEPLTDHMDRDLHFLEDLIAVKTLIQLGENSHGIKGYNQLKVRIIKYLHKELNFNVIAFESGMCFSSATFVQLIA